MGRQRCFGANTTNAFARCNPCPQSASAERRPYGRVACVARCTAQPRHTQPALDPGRHPATATPALPAYASARRLAESGRRGTDRVACTLAWPLVGRRVPAGRRRAGRSDPSAAWAVRSPTATGAEQAVAHPHRCTERVAPADRLQRSREPCAGGAHTGSVWLVEHADPARWPTPDHAAPAIARASTDAGHARSGELLAHGLSGGSA